MLWFTIPCMNASQSKLEISRAEMERALDAQYAGGEYVAAQAIETPLGTLLTAAVNDAICYVEFSDRCSVELHYAQIRKHIALPVLTRANDALAQLRAEFELYFQGKQKHFYVRVEMRGTPFQERVWGELQNILYGETISYAELARRVGQPNAVRAAARANGTNRISILIPCHRVIGSDGKLTGYGGGLWRKRLLLQLEQTGNLSDA